MKYKNENEILSLVESFESAAIARANWRHAEHLTIALYYLLNNDFDAAYKKMRHGIFNLLKAFEVDLSKEMPYHETLTVFWLKTIDDFKNSKNNDSILEIANELCEKFDKDYPLAFYSRERLFSEEARSEFIGPD